MLAVSCSLFVVCYVLFGVRCLLRVVRQVSVVCCMLFVCVACCCYRFVLCCMLFSCLFTVCCSLCFVVRCVLLAAYCALPVARCLSFVVRWLLAVRCSLFVVR